MRAGATIAQRLTYKPRTVSGRTVLGATGADCARTHPDSAPTASTRVISLDTWLLRVLSPRAPPRRHSRFLVTAHVLPVSRWSRRSSHSPGHWSATSGGP